MRRKLLSVRVSVAFRGHSSDNGCVSVASQAAAGESNSCVPYRGHRGPVLRPRCIGPGEGPYAINHSILLSVAFRGHSSDNGCVSVASQAAEDQSINCVPRSLFG